MIVPHRHERPAGPRVLEVWIGEIGRVDGAIAIDGQRMWKLPTLLAIGDARDLIDRTVVSRLHFVGILDDLVDEIAEVQDETELVFWRRVFIFEDHPAIGVELAFIDILTANESEAHGAGIVSWPQER